MRLKEHKPTEEKPRSSPRRIDLPYQRQLLPTTPFQRARRHPSLLTPANVLQLQRTIGNQAVGRILTETRAGQVIQQADADRTPIAPHGTNLTIQRSLQDDVLSDEGVSGKNDPLEKADAAFEKFIELCHTRSVAYSTTAKRAESDIANEGTKGACGSFATAFVKILKATGLEGLQAARVLPLDRQRFVTKPITNRFIDPNAVGNVHTRKQTYGQIKRFLFFSHYVVDIPGIGKRYDATAGTKDGGIEDGIDYDVIPDPKVRGRYLRGSDMRFTKDDEMKHGSGFLQQVKSGRLFKTWK